MGCLKNIISLGILILAVIGFKVIGGFEFVAQLIDTYSKTN